MLKCEHATNLWWISLLSTWSICIEWQRTGISFGCYFLCINCIVDTLFANFLCPQDRRSEAYCFCPVCHSVIPSFCHSETLTLLITLQQWVLELWYLTWIFPVIRPFCGYHYLLPCDLDLDVWSFFENFNLANNFSTVSDKALIFYMNIPCCKTFLWVPLFSTLWPWPWSLTHFLKTLTLL